MKLVDQGIAKFDGKRIQIPIPIITNGGKAITYPYTTELKSPEWELQNTQPIKVPEFCEGTTDEIWLFKETPVLTVQGNGER